VTSRSSREGQLDPTIGRFKEIERVMEVLTRRKKNNPVLIGEPGVGKTAIVEGLASSSPTVSARIRCVIIASCRSTWRRSSRHEVSRSVRRALKAVMNEIAQNKNIILFIDELHTLVGAVLPRAHRRQQHAQAGARAR
jgi:ATP-dependent Clp protease ATP-binding subunit ClpC